MGNKKPLVVMRCQRCAVAVAAAVAAVAAAVNDSEATRHTAGLPARAFAPSGPPLPRWAGPVLNHSKPLGGLSLIPNTTHTEVYHGNEIYGTYNHAAMLGYHNNTFILAWKNGPYTEDKDGQRILYSQSSDGISWDKINDSRDPVLFPSLTTSKRACAMFVGPPAYINGRLYMGASPGEPTDAAAGAQFCLWPDPVTPRNCGPPQYPQAVNTLLMREVLGRGLLGPLFWASMEPPKVWEAGTKQYGIRTLSDMDVYIQEDIVTLQQNLTHLPCADRNSGNLKCEACYGGCQLWDSIHIPPEAYSRKPGASAIGNERTHYTFPPQSESSPTDVILYRSDEPFLFASMRTDQTQGGWGTPQLTTIPNDESNLNAGTLPDGRIYLLNNAVYVPKPNNSFSQEEELRFRDPLVLSTSKDGYTFTNVSAVISCTSLSENSTCAPRFMGGGKNPGPSYPQGLVITAPAPEAHHGFYVVATNNKEDVWITKVQFDNI